LTTNVRRLNKTSFWGWLANGFRRAGARLRSLEWPAWLALSILPLALRLYHLDYQNLWLDETLTWADSQLPIYWLLRRSALNVHPPGVFLLMKAWTSRFGASPAMLRLPFAVISLIIIGLAFKFTRLLLPAGVAVLVLLLLTLSPHQIFFAQEARMYTLATALTLGAVICYLQLQRRPFAGWPYRIGFVILFVAALHTHYFTAFILAAVNLHFITRYFKTRHQPGSWPQLWSWIGLNAIVALACVPWLSFVLLHPPEGRVRNDWRPVITLNDGLLHLRDLFLQMTVGYNVYLEDLSYAFTNYQKYPDAIDARDFFLHRFLIFAVGIPVMIGLFIKGVWRIRRQASEILFLFFVPLLLVLGVLLVAQREMVLSRYLMLISPYFLVILAAGVVSLKTMPRRILAASALMLAMSLALIAYYHSPTRGSDYRPVAGLLKQQYQLGDVIVADPSFMDRCLLYYLNNPSLWRALINTDSADTTTNYLTVHGSLPCVWLVLDYRSDLFEVNRETLRSLWPSYAIDMEARFPEQSPKVRVLRLRFARRAPS
jgi:uncharacterized membrane protein